MKCSSGCRKGRSCEDQILKIVQAIENGFQIKPVWCSVLSKAYDNVWRHRLLLPIVEKAIPMTLGSLLLPLTEAERPRRFTNDIR